MIQLQAKNLIFDYPGPVRALAGVDIQLDAEELLVVLGPNGSGKSTLLRCMSGLESPTQGEVLLSGAAMATVDVRKRARKIAVVPQFLPALPDVLVEYFVLGGRYSHFRRLRGADAHDIEIVHNALEACAVAELAERLMSEISGGQRQRVLLARALAQEAEILLIDEPTNALDPKHQISVFKLIGDLVAKGRSVIVVTHDMNLTSQFATRLVLLDEGRVVAEGSVEEVLQREVLEPVYGTNLHYGRLQGADRVERPIVMPWLVPGS